jgi:hypothetical protein
MNTLSHPAGKPWYREPWPWFLISLPATAVIAGLTTVWIAATSADGLVVGDYYKAGLAINQTLARDDAARALALHATFEIEDDALALTLAGRLQAYPGSAQPRPRPPDAPGTGSDARPRPCRQRALPHVDARPGGRQMARPAGRRRLDVAAIRRAAHPIQPARHADGGD